MKGKDIINHAMRAEIPDPELIKMNILRNAKVNSRSVEPVKRYSHASAACLVIILILVAALVYKNNLKIQAPLDYSLRGLQVANFELSDVNNDGTTTREVFSSFSSLLLWRVSCFAVVRVTDTRITEDERQQISEVLLLQNVYGEFETGPIELSQYIQKNHFSIGTTNLLRKGGVYFLPLKQNGSGWTITGDMDVLFEIDDKGKVWSHSSMKNFNYFDGKDIEYMIEELQVMFSDEDYMLASTSFGNTLKSMNLAEITITSISDVKTDSYGRYYDYTFTVNRVISIPSRGAALRTGETAYFSVYDEDADMINILHEGRYLAFLHVYDRIGVKSGSIARIEEDDSITVETRFLSSGSLAPYNGYKLEEILELVTRIKAVRGRYEIE